MILLRRNLFALILLVILAARAVAGPFAGLEVFGDSLSDIGNVAQVTASLFPLVPLTPGPYYYQGRFSNGPIYVETLAAGLGLDPIVHSRSGGTDFAHGGALTTGTMFPQSIAVQDIDDQVSAFLSGPAADPDALFVVFAGANDLLGDPSNTSKPISSLEMSMERLIGDGARQFLVPNLPPLGETPRFNGNRSVADQYDAWTNNFNNALEVMLSSLETSNPGLTIHRFDLAGLFDQMINSPALFGLTNVTHSAAPGLEPGDNSYTGQIVGNPDEYLFWDDLHPTAAVHAIVAEHILSLFVLAGDYNGNDVIDAADYSVWRDAMTTGATSLTNDPTPGTVDESDFLYWRDHFGESLGSGTAASVATGLSGGVDAAVPEPASGALLCLGVLGVWVRYRRFLTSRRTSFDDRQNA